MMRAAVALLAAGHAVANTETCVSSYDATMNYFPDTISPAYSQLWTAAYFDTFKVINMSYTGRSIVAWQCGTPRPNISYATDYVKVPVDKVAVTTTTYIPWVELIGKRSSFAAYTSDFSSVSSPCLNAMYAAGTTQMAYDSSTWSRDDALLQSLEVDVTFADTWSASAYNALVVTPSQETTNLAMAEYLKVFGALFNLESTANAVFAEIERRFTCTTSNMALLGDTPKKVLWASWYAGGWTVGSCPNYYCEFIDAAGGDMITTSITGSLIMWGYPYLNTSEFLSVAAEADVFLYVGGNFSTVLAAEPTIKASTLPCFQRGNVYSNDKRGDNDWFESRMSQPDAVLEDIASILHPMEMAAHNRLWFRDAFDEPGGAMPTTCADTNAKAELLSDGCSVPTTAPTAAPTVASVVGAAGRGAAAFRVIAFVVGLASVAISI